MEKNYLKMFSKIKRIIRKIGSRSYEDIYPDEVFLDSENLPQFDDYQFEGRIERPISTSGFYFFTAFFLVVLLAFTSKIWQLQVVKGAELKERSENNSLKQTLLIAPRGLIYDRNAELLVWNSFDSVDGSVVNRIYSERPGISNTLGFIKYPKKDKNGFYYEEEFVPKDGVELFYNEIVTGKNGLKLVETSVLGEVISESTVELPRSGENLTLSIDSNIQSELYKQIEGLAKRVGFQGGAGIIMDVHSGEILAMSTYPEYSSEVLNEGKEVEKINSYFKDKNNPFLNRVVSGLYTPGSIVKPFVALAALEEKIISPDKEIVSTGKLVVPNPYNPDQPTIFKDWKAHGAVDMKKALAVSSDVYFYQVGGGFGDQKGLGIERLEKYFRMFGLGSKTGFLEREEVVGVIPNPKWKEETFDGEFWRIGNTYHTAIGQYGMQITPIQAVRATAAIANGGYLVTPSLVFTSTSSPQTGKKIGGNIENYKIVREGMRQAVTQGTASGLNVPFVDIAAKTGTAELGAQKQFVNSWVVGFFPYEDPKYAFTIVMEKGPVTNLVGGTYVMRQLVDWMNINKKEYFK